MATVSSIVVRRRLATMRQVEDALARQTLYGGDVVTNLLDVAPPPATDEAALTGALAEALEIPAAPLDALRAPDPAAVSRVPRDVAERHGFVPIAVRDGALVVALAEPLSSAAAEEVELALGAPIRQQAAPLVRLRQALERAYGVPMDRRTRRLASILDGGTGGGSMPPPRRSSIPDVPDDPLQPTPAAATARDVEAPHEPSPSRPPPATTIRVSRPGAQALQWFVKGARGESAPPKERRRESSPRISAPGRRRRGPFTRDEALKVFADPPSTEAVLGALVEFAQQWFAYVALFLVQDDVAEGWDALGVGAAGERVRKMGIPLDLPSAFSAAREGRAPILQPRAKDGLDAVVASDLERPAGGDVLVAPVVVGKRVVALLYADDAGQRIGAGDIGDVLTMVAEAGAALARYIVRRKKGTPAAPPVRERRSEPAVLAERAGALVKALGAQPQTPSLPSPERPAQPSAPIESGRSITVESGVIPSSPADEALTPIVHVDVAAANAAAERTVEPPRVERKTAPLVDAVGSPKRNTVPIGGPSGEAKPETKPFEGAAAALAAFEAANAHATSESVRPASLSPIVSPIADTTPADAKPAKGRTLPPRRGTDPMGAVEPPPAHAPGEASGVPLERVSQEISALRDLEDGDAPSLRLPSQPGKDEPPSEPKPVPQRVPVIPQPVAAPTPPPPHLAGRRALGPIIPREEPEIRSAAGEPAPSTAAPSDPEAIETADVSDDELEELLSLADRTGAPAPPSRESERFEIYAPREPPRPTLRSIEHELPKVIVAIEPEYVGLVGKVLKGGDAADKAAAELRSYGVAALPAIMDRFPGPTRCDRTTPIHQVPPASKAGPLLGLLVALGRLALRDVLARLGDPLPETRFWATWLLTEIVDDESAAPLVPRLVDDDLAVRRASWVAARALLAEVPRTGDVLIEPLVGVLLDPGGGTSLRIRAANALGELRDARAVEGLILGLEAREPEIAGACHEALIAITRHDPVSRGKTWAQWFSEHGGETRIEWLIEALLEDDIGLRAAAALELKEQTKVYFGYYANLPRAEREQAYRRYRAWWTEEGHLRFGTGERQPSQSH